MGCVPEDHNNFDIKKIILSGLRETMFAENAIRDPWVHLACFYETTSMCKSTNVIED